MCFSNQPSRAMSTTDAPTLSDALAAQRQQAQAQIPDEALDVMQQVTADLEASGQAKQTLQPGDAAPSFALPNATGETVRLDDALAEGPVVLSFYRGGWCPYCSLELRALQEHLEDIHALGAQLIAISPQTPDASLDTAEKQHLDFEVLSDEGNAVTHRYGLVFQVPNALKALYEQFGIDLPAANGDDSWTLPIPATFVLDPAGTVRYAFAEADYTQRAEPSAILEALRDLR